MLKSSYDTLKPGGCVHWALANSNSPARPCGAQELVTIDDMRMCRIHRTHYLKTGKIITKDVAGHGHDNVQSQWSLKFWKHPKKRIRRKSKKDNI